MWAFRRVRYTEGRSLRICHLDVEHRRPEDHGEDQAPAVGDSQGVHGKAIEICAPSSALYDGVSVTIRPPESGYKSLLFLIDVRTRHYAPAAMMGLADRLVLQVTVLRHILVICTEV